MLHNLLITWDFSGYTLQQAPTKGDFFFLRDDRLKVKGPTPISVGYPTGYAVDKGNSIR